MNRLDVTGKKFWRLTGVSPVGQRADSRAFIWRWRCDCGADRDATATEVKHGHIKQCKACAAAANLVMLKANGHTTAARHHKKAPGVSARHSCFSSYKNNAQQRGRKFSLTEAEFFSIVNLPCVYCGQKDTSVCRSRHNNGDFHYTGIDRVDSHKGYESGNLMPCCKQCNWAKSDLSRDQFLTWIRMLAENVDKA